MASIDKNIKAVIKYDIKYFCILFTPYLLYDID
jgi:hypothetical protein